MRIGDEKETGRILEDPPRFATQRTGGASFRPAQIRACEHVTELSAAPVEYIDVKRAFLRHLERDFLIDRPLTVAAHLD